MASINTDPDKLFCQTKPWSNITCRGAYYYDAKQRKEIVRQVVEKNYSPTEVGRKYKVSSQAIRDWVKKSGLSLPKTYSKMDRYVA